MKPILIYLLFLVVAAATAQDIGLQLYSLRNQIPGNVEATLKMVKS